MRPSYLYNENPFTSKITYLYWNRTSLISTAINQWYPLPYISVAPVDKYPSSRPPQLPFVQPHSCYVWKIEKSSVVGNQGMKLVVNCESIYDQNYITIILSRSFALSECISI